MKVTLTDKYAPREGDTIDVTEAAARRLVDGGYATKGNTAKAEAKSTSEKVEPTKAPTKRPSKKAAAPKS